MLRHTAILLCFVAVSQQLSISEFEVPNAARFGEDAELTCDYELLSNESEADLFVKWWFTALGPEGDRTQLFQQSPGQPGTVLKSHNVHKIKIKDNNTLVLDNVTPSDSGIYECEVSNIDEVRKHNELVVYTEGSGPQLNVSTVSDGPDEDAEEDILVECQAKEVAPYPDFILTINGVENELSKSVIGPDTEGLYEIYGNVTLTKEAVDGADIRCELIFLNSNIAHPQYVDYLTYDPSGALSTTEVPEDVSQPDATPESLENSTGKGRMIECSWSLLLSVGVLKSLLSLL